MKRTIAFLILALASGPIAAADFIVNSTADVPDAIPGNLICDPVNAVGNTCTLRAAIMEANAQGGSHNILLPSGTYTLSRLGEDEDAALTGDLDISADILITNGTSSPPRITTNYNDRVFDVKDGGELTLVNIHVSGGEANSPGTTNGGGIRVEAGASLNLEEAIVSSNIGNIGGGIYSDGSVRIENSYFFNNVITDDNVFSDLAAGTAILTRGQLVISQSTFRANGVIPGGAGLFLTQEYAIEAREGFVPDPATQISNSTFHGNTRGVFSNEVPLGIAQSTFSENGALGLRFLPKVSNINNLQLQISSSVFVGHETDCNGPYGPQNAFNVDDLSNASSDTSCSFTGISDFENIEYPFLDELPTDHGGSTLVLMPNPLSELVDPVEDLCVTSQDQRGRSRPIDSGSGLANCDIGAVEYDPAIDPVPEGIFADGFEDPAP